VRHADLGRALDAVADLGAGVVVDRALDLAFVEVELQPRQMHVGMARAHQLIAQRAGDAVRGAGAELALVHDRRAMRAQIDGRRQPHGAWRKVMIAGVLGVAAAAVPVDEIEPGLCGKLLVALAARRLRQPAAAEIVTVVGTGVIAHAGAVHVVRELPRIVRIGRGRGARVEPAWPHLRTIRPTE
jgi:hypothetical protein